MFSFIPQFLGVGNRSCRLCGRTSLKRDMFHDPELGWFCDWPERCKWAKWQGQSAESNVYRL